MIARPERRPRYCYPSILTTDVAVVRTGMLIRAFRNLGPLVVCFAVACAMMAPFEGERLRESTASDLAVHCSGIIEAYNALVEGQFPVRVAPSHNGGHGGTDFGGIRYPLFQFYGQFPYTAGGLLCLVFGVNAFTAWKVVQLAAITLGGFYAYRCGVATTRRRRAALVGGVVFMTAPYMWTDLHTRFAFTELVSFNLLPVVMFYATRAFGSRRWGYVLLGGVAWSLLALSHNVTFLYASALLGLYFVSQLSVVRVVMGFREGLSLSPVVRGEGWGEGRNFEARRSPNRPSPLPCNVAAAQQPPSTGAREQEPSAHGVAHQSPRLRLLWRVGRVGVAYALGIALTLWYLMPQLHTVPLLNIRIQLEHPRPVGADLLTPLHVLLSPVLKSPEASPTARLGLQVGWPALAAVALGVTALVWHRRNRLAIARLLFFFAIAFFVTWSPAPTAGFDLWRLLPRIFAYVQSSYRILMFVTLFAALLVPYALATRRGRDLPAWAMLLVLAAVAAASLSYVPTHDRLPADALAKLVAHPLLDGLRDYLIAPGEVARTSATHPDMNWAEPIHGVVPHDAKLEGSWRSLVPAPAVAEGQSGVVTIGGTAHREGGGLVGLQVVLGGKPASFELPTGAFQKVFSLPGRLAPGPLPIELAVTGVEGEAGTGTVILSELRFAGPEQPGSARRRFVSAKEALADTRKGSMTTYAAELGEPSLVQLPVLYYPRMLRVRVDGADVEYGNVGRFVSLEMPAGRHEATVEFAGVRWANWLSAMAWLGVLAAAAFIASTSVWMKRRQVPSAVRPPSRATPGRGPRWWEAAASAALLFAVIGHVPVAEAVRRRSHLPLDGTVTASRPGDEQHPPAHAFDADDTTFWFVPGGTPATLTIEPRQAEKFRRITLLARKSGLWEAWKKARVELYLRGELVFQKDYHLADAETQPEQVIRFKATRANRIVLTFSDPVTVTRDGTTRVDANGVSPGYREIQID